MCCSYACPAPALEAVGRFVLRFASKSTPLPLASTHATGCILTRVNADSDSSARRSYATTSPLASPGTKQVGEHAYEVKYAVNEQAALERGGVTVHDGMSHVQPDYEVALPHGRQPSGPLRGEMEPAVAGGPADYVAPSAVGSRKQSLQDDLYAIPDGGFEA